MKNKSKSRVKKKLQYFDYNLLAVIVFLTCFGLVMLYSTSSYSAQVKMDDGMFYFKRQLFFSVVSIVIMLITSRINYHIYAPFATIIFWFSIVLMALVLSPLGVENYGARRWLSMPANQQIQPSEVAKIAVILFIPYLMCKIGKQVHTLKGMLSVMAYGVIASVSVIVFTDNLSTGIIVLGISCILIFVVHPKTAPFIAIIAVGMGILMIALQMFVASLETSSNFRVRRLIVWLQPETHSEDGGYQVMQALYAIGSGGFFGKGLGNSTQKLGVIPEVQNDMILSIICEELGVFGAIIVLVLFGILLYRLLFIAQNAPDLYGSLIVTGIFAHIALQVILNVAVVTNLIPTTGITLPFISYGGTSILFLMIEMGIALGVSRTIKIENA